jgi:superfamily II DNA or RNA helicase
MPLYPFQRKLVAGIHRAVNEGASAVLMQSPTGSGKTSTIVEGVIAPSLALGRRFVFAAHLEELIDDTAGRIRSMGIPCGTVKADRPADPTALVQVCSTQTLASMLSRGVGRPPPHPLVLDEANPGSSATNRQIIGHYKSTGALILGLEATPCRGDEQPLDEFDAMVCGPSVRELIDGGFLVEPIVHAPAKVLTKGVAEDPAELVNHRCQGRRAVIFASTAAHALDIAARIPGAETVLDSTPYAIRSTVRERLATGETQHLVTVKALIEGFDAPVLDAVVLCGAFTTVAPYLQAIGRGLRAYTCPVTGRRKVDCHVYDLRGAVHLHGLPDDARRWSLEGAQGRSMVERPKPLRRCEACHHLFAPRTVCPACGSVHHSPVPMLRVQRAALFAASSIPIGARVQQWVDGAVRAITAKRPDISPAWARAVVLKKPPSWVREYLENQSVSQAASHAAGDVHAS